MFKKPKDSTIAEKEVGNPRYILDLLLSVIHISVQTVELVSGLPKIKFE